MLTHISYFLPLRCDRTITDFNALAELLSPEGRGCGGTIVLPHGNAAPTTTLTLSCSHHMFEAAFKADKADTQSGQNYFTLPPGFSRAAIIMSEDNTLRLSDIAIQLRGQITGVDHTGIGVCGGVPPGEWAGFAELLTRHGDVHEFCSNRCATVANDNQTQHLALLPPQASGAAAFVLETCVPTPGARLEIALRTKLDGTDIKMRFNNSQGIVRVPVRWPGVREVQFTLLPADAPACRNRFMSGHSRLQPHAL